MDERTQRSLTRTILAIVTMSLVVLVLSACGFGGDDDSNEALTEPAEVVENTPVADTVADLTGESSPADASTASAPADVTEQATPPDGGSPTPAIVVSAPPVTVPTAVPTPPGTPGASGGNATPVDDSPSGSTASGSGIGDGTGGAVVGGDPGQAEPDTATPGSPDAGAQTTVASCDVATYPPFAGDDATRTTTIDVNFRAGPGIDCDPIGEPLTAGTVLEVLSAPVTRDGDDQFIWVAVVVDGTEGWLATEFLEPATE